MNKLHFLSKSSIWVWTLIFSSIFSFGAFAENNPVQINFKYVSGTTVVVNPDTFPGWNTISHYQSWSSRSGVLRMKDSAGNLTTIGAGVYSNFYGGNTSGASSTVMNMIDDVSKSNFFGNSTYKGAVKLTGLKPDSYYKISIFGSRNGTSSTADVLYTFNDVDNSSLTLSCANNATGMAIFNNLRANSDSTLILSLDFGASNTIGYTYLAAIQVLETGNNVVAFSPVLVNFGPDAVTGWNSLTSYSTSGTPLNNMVDNNGNITNISLKVTTGFYGNNATTGMGSTTTDLNMPDEVSKSNMFKNASGGVFSITGLDSSKKYKFTIFGSRGDLTEARNVVYALNDASSSSVTLDVANNATNLAVLDEISPNANGSLNFTLNFGENNTTFTHINALKIELASSQTTGLWNKKQDENNSLKVYRSGSIFKLMWDSENNSKALVQIYNVQGKLLQNISVSGSNSVDVNIENSGVYVVKVNTDGKQMMTKFIR